MKELAQWALARAREPSTYAGLGSLLMALHVADAQSWASSISAAMIGIAGVAAMAMKETGNLN